MVDYSKIQRRLNEDSLYRKRFLSDPVALLRAEGVKVTPNKAEALNEFAWRARRGGRSGVQQVGIEEGACIQLKM
jgi:hypothetical protein